MILIFNYNYFSPLHNTLNMFLKCMLRLGSQINSVVRSDSNYSDACVRFACLDLNGRGMAAVLAGVGLVSPDFAQVRLAQTGVGRIRDSSCYKRYMYTIYLGRKKGVSCTPRKSISN